MAKEWILNMANGRWGLTKKNRVGLVSAWIRECGPKKIEPAPNEWDRLYNVDFYIKVGDKYIGLQIKPTTFEHAPEYGRKWKEAYKSSHEKFKAEFCGKFFIILSVEEEKKKKIFNIGIVEEIRREIERLKG